MFNTSLMHPRLLRRSYDPDAILGFWRSAGPELWFAKDPAFDRRFGATFSDAFWAARERRLDDWEQDAEGALALTLLFDQYPRNAFRGQPAMYATDAHARRVADTAIARGFDQRIEGDLRLFFYLPFGHSEDLVHQDRSVLLCATLGPTMEAQARHHRDIVVRFGRFPHRNAILDRATTDEEAAWLAAGGYAG